MHGVNIPTLIPFLDGLHTLMFGAYDASKCANFLTKDLMFPFYSGLYNLKNHVELSVFF